MESPVHPARVHDLNDARERRGGHVLYWMQQSQRAVHNDALEHAVALANERRQPLLVVFGLDAGYPEANRRHFRFLLEGLRETQARLAARGIALVVRRGAPDAVAIEAAARASVVVCDRGYLRHQRAWRRRVAAEAGTRVVQVEADVVVPVKEATDRLETAARTLRPRLRARLPTYLQPLPEVDLAHRGSPGEAGESLADLDALLEALHLDDGVPGSPFFRGGAGAAEARLRDFVGFRLAAYADQRNQPHTDHVSHMSMYLHFGQLSPVWLALQVGAAAVPEESRASFLEELLVRRELAVNFVLHAPDDYDRYAGLPTWARVTLREHTADARPHLHTDEELEQARTDDPYWNAAMREMRATGYLHNHMRMYWGKQLLTWSATPEEAHARALRLNNRWLLDGRDCSSYANVGWLFGLHDRPWPERPIFGSVRSMTRAGLERKTDPAAYVAKVEALERQAAAAAAT